MGNVGNMVKLGFLTAEMIRQCILRGIRAATLFATMAVIMTSAGSICMAAEILVTNGNDSGPGSLRDAVENASPGDTINVSFDIDKINLTSGSLGFHEDMITINGNGAAIDINNTDSKIIVFASDTNFSDMTVTGGNNNCGGAISVSGGKLEMNNVDVTGNNAFAHGGGIEVSAKGNLIMNGGSITNNTAGGNGSGIFILGETSNVDLNNVVISGNKAGQKGGGVFGDAEEGKLDMKNCTVKNNISGVEGGGLCTVNIEATVVRCAITNNKAGQGGGGLCNEGGNLTVKNSTISENSAGEDNLEGGGGSGGGCLVKDGNVSVKSSTVADNAAMFGGNLALDGGMLSIDSVVIDPASTEKITIGTDDLFPNRVRAFAEPSDNCALFGGTFNSLGNNIDRDGTCGLSESNDISGVENLILGPLQDNGGPTFTHALLEGSPAIDAGGSDCEDTDQRGVRRPQGEGCDIGAFELEVVGACSNGVDDDGDGLVDCDDPQCEGDPDCTDEEPTASPTLTISPTSTPTSGETPEPTATPTPDDGSKSFTFNCERSLKIGPMLGLEKLVLKMGKNEHCTLKLTNLEPGTPVEISSLLRKGLLSAIKIEPARSETDLNGELEITIIAIRKGIDWAAWAVKNHNGNFEFSKKSYGAGLAWGMFVEVQ